MYSYAVFSIYVERDILDIYMYKMYIKCVYICVCIYIYIYKHKKILETAETDFSVIAWMGGWGKGVSCILTANVPHVPCP